MKIENLLIQQEPPQMRRGHRRTQSDTLVLHSYQDNNSKIHKPNCLKSSDITKLLAISDNNIKQKISNIDTLVTENKGNDQFFQFGKASMKKTCINKSKLDQKEYLGSIPEKKQGNNGLDLCEIPLSQSNSFRKINKPSQLIQNSNRLSRSPFIDTLNFGIFHRITIKDTNQSKINLDNKLDSYRHFSKISLIQKSWH